MTLCKMSQGLLDWLKIFRDILVGSIYYIGRFEKDLWDWLNFEGSGLCGNAHLKCHWEVLCAK